MKLSKIKKLACGSDKQWYQIVCRHYMLIGQTNFEILNIFRAKIMPELNYSYRQLSYDQGDHPILLSGDNLPKQIKDISGTYKLGFANSRKLFTLSSTISILPHIS